MKLRLAAFFIVLSLTVSAFAQSTPSQPATKQTPAPAARGNTTKLRPPKGSRIAIVTFEDLQCPDCAQAENTLKDAQQHFNIPLVRHDFPLPQHNWSYNAHVIARWFDTKSPELGEEFRHWVFANQISINKANLRGMAERFADEHNLELPQNVDPKGELAAKVQADFAYGQQIGVGHTPTIFIVSDSQRSEPMVEVVDRTQMFSIIDRMQKELEADSSGLSKTGTTASETKAGGRKKDQ